MNRLFFGLNFGMATPSTPLKFEAGRRPFPGDPAWVHDRYASDLRRKARTASEQGERFDPHRQDERFHHLRDANRAHDAANAARKRDNDARDQLRKDTSKPTVRRSRDGDRFR